MISVNNLSGNTIDKKFRNEISLEKFRNEISLEKFRNEISLEKFLEKVAKIVLKGENKNIRRRRTTLFLAAARNDVKMKDVSVALIGTEEIKALNKKYRKKNKPTDVLSFNYGDSGEVVICPEIIRENAEKFPPSLRLRRAGKNTFKKEIARILIHGMLHLAGYDHEKSAKEAEKMEIKEKSYLSKII